MISLLTLLLTVSCGGGVVNSGQTKNVEPPRTNRTPNRRISSNTSMSSFDRPASIETSGREEGNKSKSFWGRTTDVLANTAEQAGNAVVDGLAARVDTKLKELQQYLSTEFGTEEDIKGWRESTYSVMARLKGKANKASPSDGELASSDKEFAKELVKFEEFTKKNWKDDTGYYFNQKRNKKEILKLFLDWISDTGKNKEKEIYTIPNLEMFLNDKYTEIEKAESKFKP